MRNRPIVLSVLATLALLLAACGGGDSSSSSTPSSSAGTGNTVCDKTTATGDLLAEVCDRGTITVSTDGEKVFVRTYRSGGEVLR